MEKYRISGVQVDARGYCTDCTDDKAQYWSVYAQKENGQSQCVFDCRDKLSAHSAMTHLIAFDSLLRQVNSLTKQLEDSSKSYSQLLAENVQQYQLLKKIYNSKPGGVYFNKFEAEVKSVLSENVHTDSVERECMARGVDMFAAKQRDIAKEQEMARQFEFSRHCSISADESAEFAAELRAGNTEGDDV
ncbi:hypothetical protein ABW286_05030 [Erwinia papayae]|uniref:Uncharacterized protein n=1 Tax=Erwinia papayae TaxID=206499 RepID=A0ABV3MYB7_9GAMM